MYPINLRYALLLFICLPIPAFAQLIKLAPARHTPAKTTVHSARQLAGEPLSLPFWDDFSFANGHPSDSLWIINKTVFVNDGQAVNPPSINVATFDGYNENGMPYSTVAEETGYRDTLESQLIKLADVPAMYRNSIYLSFFYQAGGNSEIPDPGDFLKLEFKSTEGWREIHRFTVKSNADPSVFYDTAIQIQQAVPGSIPEYFHNAFQFRFVSFGKTSGPYDGWHLDYVYLNRRVEDEEERISLDPMNPDAPTPSINEYDKNTNISDRTATQPFTTIFTNRYFAMPRTHFREKKHLTKPLVSMYSLKHVTFVQVVNYATYFTITHYNNNIATTTFDNILTYPDDPDGIIPFAPLPVLEHSTQQIRALPDTSFFRASHADSTMVHVKIAIDGGDNDPLKDFYARYGDIDFKSNDTLKHTYLLSNYYAYDDGVAEYAMTLAKQGNQFAYRFVMDNEVDQDTLNGVDIYFPYAAGTVPPDVAVFVFNDKAGKPDSAFMYRQSALVTRTANNLFTKIRFNQGIVVKDTFYIGYLETITGKPDRIRIGLDASHDTGDQIYVRESVYHSWIQNDQLVGSVMIRPRFGNAPVITGIEDHPNPVSVYPNPNTGEFYMKGRVDNLQIISLTGQSINFDLGQQHDSKKIHLRGAAPGLYIVRYRSGSKVYTTKILVKE